MERFAFIVHPISAKRDVAKKYPIAKFLPEAWVESAIRRIKPYPLSEIHGIKSLAGPEAMGWFIGCPLTPRQFLQLPEVFVIARIIEAAKIAQELGARIVGLGAFTSIVGDAGISVAEAVDIAVTTGNTYTIATALQATRKAAELLEIDLSNATAAVIGASGSIGSACATILAREVPRLILVGRNRERLEPLAEKLRPLAEITCSQEIDTALSQADIVLTVTSSLEAIITPEALKPGSIVCDVARPRDVSVLVAKTRPDVLVIEGGVVAVPGDVEFNFNFGFPPKTAYACMAETMILALEGRYEPFSLGRNLEVEKVEEISRLAAKHGFSLAGFRCFEKPVTEETISRVRQAAEKARSKVKSA